VILGPGGSLLSLDVILQQELDCTVSEPPLDPRCKKFRQAVMPGRWLTATELLCAQGYPAFPWMSGHASTSFAKPRAATCPRNLATMREQAGDTFNINVIAVMLLFCIVGVQKNSAADVLYQVFIANRRFSSAGQAAIVGDSDAD
jgi:hypothetical protein